MDEVIVFKLKKREETIHSAPLELENCECCGHLMPEGCIGWCASCDTQNKSAAANEDFWAWGGWRRAFYDDGEPYIPGTVCRSWLRLVTNV